MQDEWYQRDQVKKGLNQNHNMIIIDGPPGKLRNGKRDYGGFLYKKRIATKGRGKSGSVRTLLALQMNNKAYFLYGFEKSPSCFFLFYNEMVNFIGFLYGTIR